MCYVKAYVYQELMGNTKHVLLLAYITGILLILKITYSTCIIQVVVLASLAQLLVFVKLARCARSIQIEIKDVICM